MRGRIVFHDTLYEEIWHDDFDNQDFLDFYRSGVKVHQILKRYNLFEFKYF